MKVLLVGSGGREHALAWKLKQSPKVTELSIAPGNPGTAELGTNIPAATPEDILAWLEKRPVDLVVIGPDHYLMEGLTDRIQSLGIPVFGPSKDAAEIEWSKSYAKALMKEEGIPTARSRTFDASEPARAYARSQGLPIVIKADGLAEGKGVVIAQSFDEADTAITRMLDENSFGAAGTHVVIEEYLEGLEVSIHAFCDGEEAKLFPVSKDHKRIGEEDTGPNTGGMGTVSPIPSITTEQFEAIRSTIVLPTLAALKKRGRPFTGVLYPGIMLTNDGPKVIEFNARFGDPETQTYMRMLESDLYEIAYACTVGRLAPVQIKWRSSSACCVILAAEGYPGSIKTGVPIRIPHLPEDIVVFQAGTRNGESGLVTNGGRVIGVTATGETAAIALKAAYQAAEQISFEGKQYRKDIGASIL